MLDAFSSLHGSASFSCSACQVLHMLFTHPCMGCVDTNEEASWGESRWNRVAPRGAALLTGHPAGLSRRSDGRQPCGRWDTHVENRYSVVPRHLTSLSVGMLVLKCWLCESARAAVTNTTGWVAETAAFFFSFFFEVGIDFTGASAARLPWSG